MVRHYYQRAPAGNIILAFDSPSRKGDEKDLHGHVVDCVDHSHWPARWIPGIRTAACSISGSPATITRPLPAGLLFSANRKRPSSPCRIRRITCLRFNDSQACDIVPDQPLVGVRHDSEHYNPWRPPARPRASRPDYISEMWSGQTSAAPPEPRSDSRRQ